RPRGPARVPHQRPTRTQPGGAGADPRRAVRRPWHGLLDRSAASRRRAVRGDPPAARGLHRSAGGGEPLGGGAAAPAARGLPGAGQPDLDGRHAAPADPARTRPGEHTAEVLGELGFTPDEIAELGGAVGVPANKPEPDLTTEAGPGAGLV